MRNRQRPKNTQTRAYSLLGVTLIGFLLVIARLFYWQVLKNKDLSTQAFEQTQRRLQHIGERGRIYTSDNHLLVGNTTVYQFGLKPELMQSNPTTLAKAIAPILLQDHYADIATDPALLSPEFIQEYTDKLALKIDHGSGNWLTLAPKITMETKEKLSQLNATGLEFVSYSARYYPEASMAAHVTGFVGKNETGEDVGYFGIEGELNQELQGKTESQVVATDALGFVLADKSLNQPIVIDGRDIVLTIRRELQALAETELKKGLKRYAAEAGEVIIMEPQTGKIRALASLPSYDQSKYWQYEANLYKNPSLTDIYEPGSTFKTLTVATGIDLGVITPETVCTKCGGPRTISKYTIRTWNDEYHPDISMTDAVVKSDNIAMIFAAEQIGADAMKKYLTNFGIGQPIHLDLQEDTTTLMPQKWGPVELATVSFGQGIGTTSLQLTKAISAIANEGVLMRPQILAKVIDHTLEKEIVIEPTIERRVIQSETARQVTEIMVKAAEKGEAQWTASANHLIAGKTGTSQVAVKGGYEEDQTIASFIGFAPPTKPKFIMMVKLVNPQTSPWAAETAAPLWYRIADKLFLLLNIPPDK